MKQVSIHTRTSEDNKARLISLAEADNRPLANYVERILIDHLDRQKTSKN